MMGSLKKKWMGESGAGFNQNLHICYYACVLCVCTMHIIPLTNALLCL